MSCVSEWPRGPSHARCPRLLPAQHFHLPQPETRSLFPKLPPPSSPEALWGLGGTLRSRGGAGPSVGQRPRPKAALGLTAGPCRLTYSFSRVEPKVGFYCKSREILPGRPAQDPALRGGDGFPGVSTGAPVLVGGSSEAEPRSPLVPVSWQQAGTRDQKPQARGTQEPGGAVAVCSPLLEAGLPWRGDQGWKER